MKITAMISGRKILYFVYTRFSAKKQLKGNTLILKKLMPVIKLSYNTSCKLLVLFICGRSNYLSSKEGLVSWRLINQHVQITLWISIFSKRWEATWLNTAGSLLILAHRILWRALSRICTLRHRWHYCHPPPVIKCTQIFCL